MAVAPSPQVLWSEYFSNASTGERLQAPDRFVDYVISTVIPNIHARLGCRFS